MKHHNHTTHLKTLATILNGTLLLAIATESKAVTLVGNDNDPHATAIQLVFTQEAVDQLPMNVETQDGTYWIYTADEWAELAIENLNAGYAGTDGDEQIGLPMGFYATSALELSDFTEPSTKSLEQYRYNYYRGYMENALNSRNTDNADFTILVAHDMDGYSGSAGINQDAVGGHGLAIISVSGMGSLRHEVAHLYSATHSSSYPGVPMHVYSESKIERSLFNVANFRREHDTMNMAMPISTHVTQDAISTASENDYFKLMYFGIDTALTIETTGNTDTYGYLYDSTGTLLASNDDSGAGTNFKITQTVARGFYFVRVKGHSSSTTGNYAIKVSGDVQFGAIVPSHVPQMKRCMDVRGGLPVDGAEVIQWACAGTENQLWTLTANGNLQVFNGYYAIDSACIADIEADSTYNLDPSIVAELEELEGDSYVTSDKLYDALETVMSVPEASLAIYPLSAYCRPKETMCLTVPGNSTTNGTQLTISTCGTSSGKRFEMHEDGTIRVYSGTADEKCVEVENASTGTGSSSDRVNYQIWTCDPANRKHQVFNEKE